MEDMHKLYEENASKVYCFLLSLSRNVHVSEDLTQETMLRAILNIKTFKGNCKLSVWLFQIAKNLYFEWYNKNKRVVSLSELDCYEPSDNSLEQELINKESAQSIFEFLNKLPEPYKEVFTLHTLGEVPLNQISQLYEKSDSWARVTYYRAKQMIIEKMKGESLWIE
ncbi:MAG: sigma-70 family RNA polymerase sigma factor [Clostridiales bacterium]|nr:sigma-70 family RNA polymerase sigma factor [Clostridiales bacterium]